MTTNYAPTENIENIQQLRQPSNQINIPKIILLFAALGVSAYVTYRVSRSLSREITKEI